MKNIPQMEMIWEENKNTNHWNTIVNINLWTLAYLFFITAKPDFTPILGMRKLSGSQVE